MNSNSLNILISIIIMGLVLAPSFSSIEAETLEIQSPRKQMASGVSAEDVICKSELVLMIRSNGMAACVKSPTSMKLSEVGWGVIIENMMEEVMDKGNDKELIFEEELSMGEPEQIGNNTNQTIIALKEDVSAGESQMDEEPPNDVFSIGGIDLSMAVFVEGNADAPITIIEFGDYQCPKCKQWFLEQKPIISSDYILTGIAKFYFIDSAWLGDDSFAAAEAAYCANDQGKFKEYHSILYQSQAAIQDGWAKSDSLKQFAVDIDLDSEIFNECLDSGKHSSRVSHNTDIAIANKVAGTPHFFIVGPDGTVKQITGPQPSIIFDAAINSLGY